MHRAGSARDMPRACGPHVICVDLLTDALELSGIDAHRSARAAEGFRQCARSAAVQPSARLPGPFIDRHGGANEGIADFGEFNSQVFDERSRTAGIQFSHGSYVLPKRHSESLSLAAT